VPLELLVIQDLLDLQDYLATLVFKEIQVLLEQLVELDQWVLMELKVGLDRQEQLVNLAQQDVLE
jgi:hypothetical protein